MSIVEGTYKPGLLKVNESSEPAITYPTIPPNQTILGKVHKEPRKRPIADVRFQYASIKLWGLPEPVILVDKTGYFSTAIIPAY